MYTLTQKIFSEAGKDTGTPSQVPIAAGLQALAVDGGERLITTDGHRLEVWSVDGGTMLLAEPVLAVAPRKNIFSGGDSQKKASQRSLFWLAFLLAVAPRKNVFAWDPPKLLD